MEEQTYVFIIVHLHDGQNLLMGFVSRNSLVYIFNGIGVEVRRGRVSKEAPAAHKDTTLRDPVHGLHFTRLGILWRVDWTDKKTGMGEQCARVGA